jgi:hypothetical protein
VFNNSALGFVKLEQKSAGFHFSLYMLKAVMDGRARD